MPTKEVSRLIHLIQRELGISICHPGLRRLAEQIATHGRP
jgi:hypothetical protein